MKEIELFYLRHCPYCRHAQRAVKELMEEDPRFAGLNIHWIEESEEPALANARDYYRVPSVFYQGEKLYEANPLQGYEAIKASLRDSFERVLRA